MRSRPSAAEPDVAAGGLVSHVEPGAALRAGLRVGDRVLSVGETPVRDVIDWRWLTDENHLTVTADRGGAELTVEIDRAPGEPLGVAFETPVFDGVRECDNACIFCFVAQLPRGLRQGLYVRDDDVRLSFLTGNFVTLTNIGEDDVARILEQRLSPLHVSVHAVDPAVRRRLMCLTADDNALAILDALLADGIDIHAQVVLVPGINDGPVLAETLHWLQWRPGVLSVGIVPMGFTAHQRRWTRSYDRTGAQAVLHLTREWQTSMRAERGIGWLYAADEFYLLAEQEVPSWSDYDSFPQYENGIGMVRAFSQELAVPRDMDVRATLVTGELFAPILCALTLRAGLASVDVLAVENRLFGGNVTVAGLLSGADIARAIREHDARRVGPEGTYLVPDVVVNSDGLLLDDVTAAALAGLAGADVRLIRSDAGSLTGALTDLNRRTGP